MSRLTLSLYTLDRPALKGFSSELEALLRDELAQESVDSGDRTEDPVRREISEQAL